MRIRSKKVSWSDGPVNVPGVALKDYESETAFQIYCADWLRKQYVLTGDSRFHFWHHSANERQNGREGFIVKMMGQAKGFPDFVHCGLKLAVEFKVMNRPVSQRQRDWLAHFKDIGWAVLVCRRFEDFKDFVIKASF